MTFLPAGRCAAIVIAGAIVAACAAQPRAESEGQSGAATAPSTDIKHVVPAPDSVGAQPTRFEWTAVTAADDYTLRVWNEADVRIVSESGLTETSIEFPADIELPAGTYFWAVVGMRDGRPVAESGLAAFVVRR